MAASAVALWFVGSLCLRRGKNEGLRYFNAFVHRSIRRFHCEGKRSRRRCWSGAPANEELGVIVDDRMRRSRSAEDDMGALGALHIRRRRGLARSEQVDVLRQARARRQRWGRTGRRAVPPIGRPLIPQALRARYLCLSSSARIRRAGEGDAGKHPRKEGLNATYRNAGNRRRARDHTTSPKPAFTRRRRTEWLTPAGSSSHADRKRAPRVDGANASSITAAGSQLARIERSPRDTEVVQVTDGKLSMPRLADSREAGRGFPSPR